MKPTLPLPTSALSLVARLSQVAPPPTSIWLIGSRANGRSRPDSDTDLLIFASREFMDSAAQSIAKPIDTDVLVVHDGDAIQEIWSSKRGSLTTWRRKLLSVDEASYKGGKFIPDADVSEEILEALANTPNVNLGRLVEYNERAIRLWPE